MSEEFQDDYGDEGDLDLGFYDDDFIPDVEPEDVDDLDLSDLDDNLSHDARDDMVEQNETVEATLKDPLGKNAFQTQRGLTKYEKTALIGIRAEQLQRGAEPYVSIEEYDPANKVTRLMTDVIEIAKKELSMGLLPLTIDRPLPSKVANHPTYEMRTIASLIHTTNPDF